MFTGGISGPPTEGVNLQECGRFKHCRIDEHRIDIELRATYLDGSQPIRLLSPSERPPFLPA